MKIGSVRVMGDMLADTWQRVHSTTVAGSAVTSITISGLDGDTAEEYILRARIIDANAGYYKVTMNTDTSGGHYGLQRVIGNSTTAGAYRNVGVDYIQICNGVSVANGEQSLVDMQFWAKSGFIRTGTLVESIGIATTTITQIGLLGFSWNNTTDNITQIVLTAGAANGFAIGTVVELYARKSKV